MNDESKAAGTITLPLEEQAMINVLSERWDVPRERVLAAAINLLWGLAHADPRKGEDR